MVEYSYCVKILKYSRTYGDVPLSVNYSLHLNIQRIVLRNISRSIIWMSCVIDMNTKYRKCAIYLFQVTPEVDLSAEEFLDQVNRCRVLAATFPYAEYCFRLEFNPWQHAKFSNNIIVLTAIVNALSNMCGGVVLLNRTDTDISVTAEHLNTSKTRLFKLLNTWLSLSSQSLEMWPLSGPQGLWAVLLVKKSLAPVVFQPGRSQAKLQIDVFGRIGMYAQNDGYNLASEASTKYEEIKARCIADSSGGTYQGNVPVHFTSAVDEEDITESDVLHAGAAGDSAKSPEAPLSELAKCKSLNWTDNKWDWRRNIKTSGSVDASLKDFIDDILRPSTPMHFTPERSILEEMLVNEDHTDLNKIAEQDGESFAIALRQVTFILPHHVDLCRPPHHVSDILTVDKNGKVCIWSLVKKHTSSVAEDQHTYMCTVGRMLKYQLSRNGCPSLSVQCILYSISDKQSCSPWNVIAVGECPFEKLATTSPSLNQYLSWFSTSESGFIALQGALVQMILARQLSVQRGVHGVGKEKPIHLSGQQMKIILRTGKVNYIQGPAGSGKTCCAFFLCERAGKERSLYFCTTSSFFEYVKYQDKCLPVMLRNDKDLHHCVENGFLDGKTCIIIDNSHTLSCSKESLMELFKVLARKESNEMCLYIFADNVSALSFGKAKRHAVHTMLRSCCEEVLSPSTWLQQDLTEVHRNTRKVVSFIQEIHPYAGILCANKEDGDNVECITMTDIWSGGLARYITHVTSDPPQSMSDTYDLGTVAVLLSDPQDEVRSCSNILQKQLPSTIIQTANDYPRKGIVVDSAENFVGLDANVCILVACSSNAALMDAEYRSFLASRAIYNAVFVVPEITLSTIRQMKFDKIDVRLLYYI